MTFNAPEIAWGGLTPVLIIAGAAVLGVLVEAFVPRGPRRTVQIVLALGAAAAAVVAVAWRWTEVQAGGAQHLVGDRVVEDLPGLAAQGMIATVALLGILVIADRTETGEGSFVAQASTRPGSPAEADATRAGLVQSEVFPLTLFSVTGMLVFVQANDLLTLLIGLEVLSLPLYVLAGTARRRRLLSQEASMKYFLMGAFASAFTIFGIALLFGYSGTVTYAGISQAAPATAGMDEMFLAGSALVIIGLLFKLGAAPFHAWTPDVYTGAPAPIIGFMAATTKVAAFVALLRFVYVAVPSMEWDVVPFLWAVATLTMVVGTVVAVVQSNIKRMLAYSWIAHAGFVLIGVTALEQVAIPAVLLYLLTYGVATIGTFGIMTLVRERDAAGNINAEATSIEQWAGLGKRAPWLAVAMTIFMLSFAGIPLTAGFIGKFTVFSAGVAAGHTWLVVLAVIASAATAYFYIRLVVVMFFSEPDSEEAAKIAVESGVSEVPQGDVPTGDIELDNLSAAGSEAAAVARSEAAAAANTVSYDASGPRSASPVAVVASEGLTGVAIVVSALATVAVGVFPGPLMNVLGQAAAFLP